MASDGNIQSTHMHSVTQSATATDTRPAITHISIQHQLGMHAYTSRTDTAFTNYEAHGLLILTERLQHGQSLTGDLATLGMGSKS